MRFALLAVLVLPVTAQAQFPEPKPTEAHKIFARDAGTWDCDVKMFLQGPTGTPTPCKGVEVNKLVAGGLYQMSTFKMKVMGRDFEGHGLQGYDPAKKAYVGTWVDSWTAAPTQIQGKYNAAKKTLTIMSDIVGPTGEKLKQKQVTAWTSDTTKKFDIYLVTPGGDVKVMSMTAKKRPKAKKKEKPKK